MICYLNNTLQYTKRKYNIPEKKGAKLIFLYTCCFPLKKKKKNVQHKRDKMYVKDREIFSVNIMSIHHS